MTKSAIEGVRSGRVNRLKLLFGMLALALLQATAIVAPTMASSLTVGALTVVSASTPFAAGCNGTFQSGTLFPNAEVEPWVAVDPTNASNVVGVWQQDRWGGLTLTGGAQGLLTGVSHDSGVTWSRTWAHFSQCSGGTAANNGNYERASDPWVTFAANGDVYQISISFNDTNPGNAVLVSKSTNHGDTWSNPIPLIVDTKATVFNDKESITGDPTNASLVYAVWDRLVFPNERARGFAAAENAFAFRGPILFSRTTNGGVSWETPRVIFDPGQNAQTISNQIVVLPDGTLVDIFDLRTIRNAGLVSGVDNVAVIRSTDKGVTWSQPIIISKLLSVGVTDPDTGQGVRTGDIIPDIAVNPVNNTLYAVWQDGRFSGFAHDDIAFSLSTNGGSTWSTPIKVNKNGTTAAFTASVHVLPNGTIGVTHYDFRNNNASAGLPTDYWLVHCHASCTNPNNWIENHIAGPFDMETAPLTARGFFVGDYEGLANIGNSFLPFFVATNSGNATNRTDVFATTAG